MIENEAIEIIDNINDIVITKIEHTKPTLALNLMLAFNLACKDMKKILAITDIINECYEGNISDYETNKRIKEIIEG